MFSFADYASPPVRNGITEARAAGKPIESHMPDMLTPDEVAEVMKNALKKQHEKKRAEKEKRRRAKAALKLQEKMKDAMGNYYTPEIKKKAEETKILYDSLKVTEEILHKKFIVPASAI